MEACIEFITYVNKNKLYNNDIFEVNQYFDVIEDITVESIKLYYLMLVKEKKQRKTNKEKYLHFLNSESKNG